MGCSRPTRNSSSNWRHDDDALRALRFREEKRNAHSCACVCVCAFVRGSLCFWAPSFSSLCPIDCRGKARFAATPPDRWRLVCTHHTHIHACVYRCAHIDTHKQAYICRLSLSPFVFLSMSVSAFRVLGSRFRTHKPCKNRKITHNQKYPFSEVFNRCFSRGLRTEKNPLDCVQV